MQSHPFFPFFNHSNYYHLLSPLSTYRDDTGRVNPKATYCMVEYTPDLVLYLE